MGIHPGRFIDPVLVATIHLTPYLILQDNPPAGYTDVELIGKPPNRMLHVARITRVTTVFPAGTNSTTKKPHTKTNNGIDILSSARLSWSPGRRNASTVEIIRDRIR